MSLLFVQQHDTMYISIQAGIINTDSSSRIFDKSFLFLFPPFHVKRPPHQTPQLVPTQNIDL